MHNCGVDTNHLRMDSLTSILCKGAPVKIHPRAPQFANQNGIVYSKPVHPVTWFKIIFPCGTIATFRSTNLIPLDSETGEVLAEFSRPARSSKHLNEFGEIEKISTRGTTLASSSGSTSTEDPEECDGKRQSRKKRSHHNDSDNPMPRRRAGDTNTHSMIILPSTTSRSMPVQASFTESGHCMNCGARRWSAGKFCWNEMCLFSPIYYRLPGCRGSMLEPIRSPLSDKTAGQPLSTSSGPQFPQASSCSTAAEILSDMIMCLLSDNDCPRSRSNSTTVTDSESIGSSSSSQKPPAPTGTFLPIS